MRKLQNRDGCTCDNMCPGSSSCACIYDIENKSCNCECSIGATSTRSRFALVGPKASARALRRRRKLSPRAMVHVKIRRASLVTVAALIRAISGREVAISASRAARDVRSPRCRDVPLPASDSHSCALDSHRNRAPLTIPPRARGFIREKILTGKFVPYLAIDIREVIGRARKKRTPTGSLCQLPQDELTFVLTTRHTGGGIGYGLGVATNVLLAWRSWWWPALSVVIKT